MINKRAVGSRIQELRKAKRLSVEECCMATKVSLSAWRKYEVGDRMPRDEVKKAIADFFDCSTDYIFFD